MFQRQLKLAIKSVHESTLLALRRSRCAVYFQKTLHFLIFAPIIIPMLSIKIGLPQYKKSPPKTQNPRKGLDIPVTDGIILSNSATQQLSNSATQQLSNSGVKEDYTRINGQLFHSDNNNIFFIHFCRRHACC